MPKPDMKPAGEPASLADFCNRKSTLYISVRSGKVVLAGNKIGLDNGGRLPLEAIRRVVLIGRANVQSAVLYRLARSGIDVDWLDIFGQPVGMLASVNHDMDASLGQQARFCASQHGLTLARMLILAKVDNCHEVLRRRTSARITQQRRDEIAQAEDDASLRGMEGVCAAEYFSAWKDILHKFAWQGRKPHPAPDPVNMLLSTGYSLLRNRLACALRHAGLNPRLGFFHEMRGRHAALASDLMEPLRALVDARVLTMLRRQELHPGAFTVRAGRCVCTDRNAYGLILEEFEGMFSADHKFYTDPQDNNVFMERTLNDLLDDLAESFAAHTHDGQGCIVPRLAPCVVI